MFERIYIELSDECGLKCSFCPHSSSPTRRGIMDIGFFEHIISQIAQGLGKLVFLHILGDPLVLKNLSSYLKIIKQYNLRAHIVNSGKFLHTQDFHTLLFAPVREIAFSLSAFVDNPRGFRDSYLQEILEFCSFSRKVKSEVFIHLRLQDYLLDASAPLLKEIAEFFGVADSRALRENLRLDYKTFFTITKHYEWNAKSPVQSNQFRLGKKPYCYGLIKQFGILSNGVVVPCCIDCFGEIALGDAHIQELRAILDSPKARSIKSYFKEGKALLPQCQKCGYVKVLR
ncbi:SPASM domain-containing protein [Helicobacter sp. 10-6591]|uniref:SPASM domain-containing protein n=1 Tax=Helicobacter sp. 10-6591 TaxID=2004998 RepID=UPI0011BF3790|nr:SPASM domain-containing protein [Helicobacter sp. 10-6591]